MFNQKANYIIPIPFFLLLILISNFLLALMGCPNPTGSGGNQNSEQVVAPQFTPGSGSYSFDRRVTISCMTSGATIHYTIDSSTPTTSSSVYTTPILISGSGSNITMTLKAIAVKASMNDSAVSTTTYSIVYPSTHAQWAQTVSTGSDSVFRAVAADASGNIFAAGSIYGTGTFTFGAGVTAAGTCASDYNIVLVKYSSSGVAQWARTVSTGSMGSNFYSVALDTNGNIYAAGSIGGTGTFTFGAGVTAAGSSTGANLVLVKYNTSGVAQWARTVSTGSITGSIFYSVAVDASGNACAAGDIDGVGNFTFGVGVTAAGSSTGANLVLVKYNTSGVAQWAQTASTSPTGSDMSLFSSVAIDAIGNIYAAGGIWGTGIFTFGAAVTATGTFANGFSVLLVKYNTSGAAQWAHTVSTGPLISYFSSLSLDTSGNVYAAGHIDAGTYTFGAGITVAGTYNSGDNVLLVKYNPLGVALWAQTVSAGSMDSSFISVAADESSNVYAAGFIDRADTYTFGSVSASGTNTNAVYQNIVLVKYNSLGVAQWAQTVSTGSDCSCFSSVAVDASGAVYAAGSISGAGTYTFWSGVTATGSYVSGNNVALVKYSE